MFNNFNLYARYKLDNSNYYSNWLSSESYQKYILINFFINKNNIFNFNHPLFGNIQINIKEIENNKDYVIYEYCIENTNNVQLAIKKYN